jgi:hypothetical protein
VPELSAWQIIQTSSVGYALKNPGGFTKARAIYAGWGRWQCFDGYKFNKRVFGRRRAMMTLERYGVDHAR